MTVVGWVGLGKLGLPCALTLEQHAGVDIAGYDPDPHVADILNGDTAETRIEQGLPELISATMFALYDTVDQVVAKADRLIFVAVQTPHSPEYGGEQPMPDSRADFDYSHLTAAVTAIGQAAAEQDKHITVVIISTALPGTVRRVILPGLPPQVTVLYNPQFIAMGTTVYDYLNPEFVLIGADTPADALPLIELYDQMLDLTMVPVRVMGIESAELTKVAYNTFISMKIVFANTMLEICDLTGADVDDVTGTLSAAQRRIMSPAYMAGGMGDGGACHPRDNIAMSWLARSLGLSTDPFEYVTRAREAQSMRLARLVVDTAENTGLPIALLGKAYKPGSDLVYGSPALLLAHDLQSLGVEFDHYDKYVGDLIPHNGWGQPTLFVVCTKHPDYASKFAWPDGSMVIDPFRYVQDSDNAEIIRLGAGWK